MPLYIVVLFLCILLHCSGAKAIEQEEEGDWVSTETRTYTSVVPYIPDFVKTPKGGVGWELLATTKEVDYAEKDADGMDLMGVRPEFTREVLALDGKEITMQGFMFPMEQSEKQSKFLFGPFPVSCPYHYHVGPAMVIEVAGREPITFSYEPVTLKGKLTLVPRDDDFNIFYRLNNAEVVQE